MDTKWVSNYVGQFPYWSLYSRHLEHYVRLDARLRGHDVDYVLRDELRLGLRLGYEDGK